MSAAPLPKAPPLVAILRGLTPDAAGAIGSALYAAGIVWIETPLNSPRPLDSIAILRATLGAEARIGAGTVLSAREAGAAAEAGADFMVAPNCDPEVIAAAKSRRLYTMPGVFTPTEAFAAIAAGADALKLFPAEAAGPAYVKALKAVLPAQVPVLAVGGVDGARMGPYLAAGVSGFGLGSSLYKPGDGPDVVRARAEAFVAAYRAAAAS